jgi:hypothetical protein
MKTRTIHSLILVSLLASPMWGRCAERFAGRFKGEGLTVEAQGDHGNYTGTMTLGEDTFKFTASEKGDGLAGSFTTPDGQFDFQAAIKGDTLKLTTGDTHYKLSRQNANPLAKAKTGDGTGAKLTSFFGQQGKSFLGQFASNVASNKGHVADSASSAGFGTLASVGQSISGAPAQDPGSASPPAEAAPAKPATDSGTVSTNDAPANVTGTSTKTDPKSSSKKDTKKDAKAFVVGQK